MSEMFKKYSELTLSNHRATLGIWDERYPELRSLTYEVTEKIHGANFSLLCEPDKPIKFCSRTKVLKEGDKFYGYHKLLNNDRFMELVGHLSGYCALSGEVVQVYGELFGGSVQKGVNYGAAKLFRWYAVRIDGEYLTPFEASRLLMSFLDLKVPVIGLIKHCEAGGLWEILNSFEPHRMSALTPEDHSGDNVREGLVYTPYYVTRYAGEHLVAFKVKNKKFLEKSKPRVKAPKDFSPELQAALNEFSAYVNEERLDSLFSKYGPLEEFPKIQEYATYYMEDAMSDFTKENPELLATLSKADTNLFSKFAGGRIFQDLRGCLIDNAA